MQHLRTKTPLFFPFRHAQFRNLCIANFISNIGGWMQIFATGWLLAKQSNSAGAAALAQTAAQAPIFLFALFGGVIADRMNQSRYLLMVNIQMIIAAALLAILTFHTTPSAMIIITLTFIIGVGAAFKVSAWQASMSSLVEPNEIEAAATLNGLSYNLASIIGPILGGYLFTLAGPASLYLANALSFLGLIILYWRVDVPKEIQSSIQKKSNESFFLSLKKGVKNSFGSIVFRKILGLTFILFFAVSIFQSLLPVYVKVILTADESMLSSLMAAFGSGAVLAAFVLPSLRHLLHRSYLLSSAIAVYGLMLLCFSYLSGSYSLLLAAFMAGFSWASIVSTMNSGAQAVFSTDMRARALAIYSLVFAGALTLGSITWGKVAEIYGITFAYQTAGLIMCITALAYITMHIRALSLSPLKTIT
ncbi:MAG: MFS transporter [Proteobacteria bacterium]|nr:MFS transporter [Pseudomonadota bacterium]